MDTAIRQAERTDSQEHLKQLYRTRQMVVGRDDGALIPVWDGEKFFLLAECCVTWTQYLRYCEDSGHAEPTRPTWAEDNHPVVNVSWQDAKDYCNYYGLKLPTTSEWEAAAGEAKFPWGDEPASKENINCWEFGPRHTVPVDALPAGAAPRGHLNMSGNVWEWCCSDPTPVVEDGIAATVPTPSESIRHEVAHTRQASGQPSDNPLGVAAGVAAGDHLPMHIPGAGALDSEPTGFEASGQPSDPGFMSSGGAGRPTVTPIPIERRSSQVSTIEPGVKASGQLILGSCWAQGLRWTPQHVTRPRNYSNTLIGFRGRQDT